MAERVMVWLRNDLRFHDNEALAAAISVLPQSIAVVYCVDPRHFGKTELCGFPKTGSFRAQFLFDSLTDLRNTLRDKGNELIIVRGKPENEIPALCEQFQISEIFYHEEATSEELSVERKLTDKLKTITNLRVKINKYWGATLFHRDDLPFEIQELPNVFTQFRVGCEKQSKIRPPVSMPKIMSGPVSGMESGDLPSVGEFQLPSVQADERAVVKFRGGETAAIDRLDEYLWRTDRLRVYKKTRNGLLGANYSSKFSAWLAFGCISPRFIASEVARYEREREQNESTYWMIFELIWRDYFRFYALKCGNSLFYQSGPGGIRKKWCLDFDKLRLWREGNTGIPFVDANMRELFLTGFQSNRGRQNVASFLAKNLGIDWRAGAEWFESQLIDYDVCSNWGNWAYVAGVGNDPRQDRYFHVIKQARDYDPEARYVKTWLPELQELEPEFAHEPWLTQEKSRQQLFENFGPKIDYPGPMLDLDSSYQHLRAAQASDSTHQSRPFHRGNRGRRK